MQETYEIERAYIGSGLIDPNIVLENPVDVNDMQHFQSRRIYQGMLDQIKQYGTVDYVVLAETLPDVELGELLDLVNATVSTLHAPAYAAEIKKLAERRELIQIAQDMVNEATGGNVDAIKYATKITNAIRVTGHTDSFGGAAQELKEFVGQRIENPSKVWGMPTPWDGYNNITGGLHKGMSVMFYGGPGVGKSIIATQACLHAAMHGYRVNIYSLEMSRKEILMRMASMHSKVGEKKVKEGYLTVPERQRFESAIDFVTELPIEISDETTWTSSEIRADQQRKNNHRADLVLVDYLALLKDKADNAHERVEHASMAMRDMAKDLNQCAIVVSSEVKDGTIKGTREVEHAQHHIWRVIHANEQDKNDPVRKLIPTKLRDCPGYGRIDLQFEDGGVPWFKEF